MMELVLIGALVFATIVGIGLLQMLRQPEREAVVARLADLELQRLPRAATLDLPFHRRVVLPIVTTVGNRIIRLIPPRSLEETRANLAMAGRRQADPLSWILRKWLLAAACGGVMLWLGSSARWPAPSVMLVAVAAAGMGYLWPEMTLRRAIMERQTRIIKELPETLDLLTISVEAGLGLDQALETVVSRRTGPLSDEVRAYLDEVRLGADRHEALKALGARTGVEDLISLAATLTQAMEYGVSIALVLRIQADEVRTRRRQRIEERAMKAPVKLLFPLIFLIMPALFVVVAGPGLIRAYSEFARPAGPGGTFRAPQQQVR